MRLLTHFLCAAALTGSAAAAASDRVFLAGATADSPPVAPPVPDKPTSKAAAEHGRPPGGTVTLDGAIREALANSPRLRAAQASEAASRGERRQAGALPNPEVSYSKENVRAGSAYKAISPAQNVYGVSQLVEVGGKVSAREHVADTGVQIAGLESQAAALDLVRDITIAYAEAVAAEESVSLAVEQKSLAEDVLKSVGVRVDAAASPLIQKSRAEVERSAAAVALDAAKRDRAVARSALAALMARDQASFKLDRKAFFTLAKRDPQAGPEKLKGNPDVLKLNTALERSKAVFDLERANGVPDPRLVAGLVEIPSAKDRALVVGVSLPIPVFNANRGNIDRARGELSRTEQLGRDAALSLGADLTRAQQQMDSAYVQAQALKTQILPSAQEGFKLAREGYEQGRFPYLEVLDAQRSLFGAKQQQIAALKAYHTARAVLERLTARHAESLKKGAYQNEN